MSQRQTILFVSNTAWNLANFRRPLIEAFVARGDRVVCAALPDGHERSLLVLDAEFEPLAVDAERERDVAADETFAEWAHRADEEALQ